MKEYVTPHQEVFRSGVESGERGTRSLPNNSWYLNLRSAPPRAICHQSLAHPTPVTAPTAFCGVYKLTTDFWVNLSKASLLRTS
jgi:hypothetical protein